MGERVRDRRHVPRLVARRDQHLADWMNELRVPLCAEPRTAVSISAPVRAGPRRW